MAGASRGTIVENFLLTKNDDLRNTSVQSLSGFVGSLLQLSIV